MLHLILGRQLSGKTTFCVNKAGELAKDGKRVAMLVPEQFNFECQKLLLDELGAELSNKIEIHSFTSLCNAILGETGGVSGRSVDDGIRFLLSSRAVANVADNLRHYSRYVSSADFINKITAVISELKQVSVSSDELKNLSENVESKVFADKLYDISLILSAYDALLGKRFIEPLDLIEKALSRMGNNSFFSEKTIIIDEFKGFTAAQYKLLDRIISGCEDVYAAFCCDSEVPIYETDIFSNVSNAVCDLKASAKKSGVQCAETVYLKNCGFKSEALKQLDEFVSGRNTEKHNNQGNDITVCNAANLYSEADFVMNNIRRLVREEGYRYRDIVIISRGAEQYARYLVTKAEKYDVPLFADYRISVGDLPLSKFVISALKAASKFDTEDVLRYIKIGFSGLSYDEVAAIENYAFVWSINGKKWLEDWKLNPKGLQDSKRKNDFDNEELNAWRKKAVMPLFELKNRLKGNLLEMCAAVYDFLNRCHITEELKKYTELLLKNGEIQTAEYQKMGYDVFIKVLDKLCAVASDEYFKVEEFIDMLEMSLGFETVGEIPQTKDQVIFGTADRIRPMRPKVVFVMGVNQGVFPLGNIDSGIFSQNERDIMINRGIKVSDCSVKDCIDEKFLFYYSSLCASHKVFFSYSYTSSDNSEMEPASEIVAIMENFEGVKKTSCGHSKDISLSDIEATVPVFEKLTANLNESTEVIEALKNYYRNKVDFSSRLELVSNLSNIDLLSLSPQTARSLYGDELRLSPSKIEDFGGCRFMYFCKYGLKAKKLDKVDFNAATRGNVIHYILEQFVNLHKEDIGTLSTDLIKFEVDGFCEQYLESVGTQKEDLSERFVYMLSVVKSTAVHIITALNNEFEQSDFKPAFCELKIGKNEEVKPITATAENGVSLLVEGTVDRVDTTKDGKVRVIDYKTGVKKFSLSSVLNGMNMQMLLYLYSLVENAADLLGADLPAGILYFPARRDFSASADERFIHMSGLVDSDIGTLTQMEKEIKGKIIPANLRKSGNGFYSYESMVSVEEFKIIFKYLNKTLCEIASAITKGDISVLPYRPSGKNRRCEYCDYQSVCRINDERISRDEAVCNTATALKLIREQLGMEVDDDGC